MWYDGRDGKSAREVPRETVQMSRRVGSWNLTPAGARLLWLLLMLSPFAASKAGSPLVTNLPASNVQATSARLNGRVLTNGGSSTTITIYYGPADGGTSSSGWSNFT